MVEDEHKEADPDLEYLKSKMNTSAVRTVESIFEQPEMKRLIRKTLVREALKSSIILCLLFTGIFTIYNALRSAVNWGLAGDVAAGATLILAAAAYLIKSSRG
jgi:3'-phosphoadenosine 5'-phosphosulfate (PAPS) 3'-phosphatase